ncbi:Myosin-IIIa [Homalodisca vitripennis]|nr:Myosin-IIIa [Homalodisca vitripennis]
MIFKFLYFLNVDFKFFTLFTIPILYPSIIQLIIKIAPALQNKTPVSPVLFYKFKNTPDIFVLISAKKQARPKPNKQQPPKNSRPPKKASEMSQDEAALVIQTQQLSKDVALVMKQYCRKWKAKSLFQVLLMYRAAKHQETVYMSQQVHLYNQNAVSAMQIGNKERVSLHNIIPDTTASQFLGRFTPKQWKLPFRLNDMPFVDSSYLCSTMGKR